MIQRAEIFFRHIAIERSTNERRRLQINDVVSSTIEIASFVKMAMNNFSIEVVLARKKQLKRMVWENRKKLVAKSAYTCDLRLQIFMINRTASMTNVLLICTYICTYVQSIKESRCKSHHSVILHLWIGGDLLKSNRAKLILAVKFKVKSSFHSIVSFLSRGRDEKEERKSRWNYRSHNSTVLLDKNI